MTGLRLGELVFRAPVARRRQARATHPCPPEAQRPRRVRHPEVPDGQPDRCRWRSRSPPSSSGSPGYVAVAGRRRFGCSRTPRPARPIAKSNVLRRLRKALKAAGLDETPTGLHDLRHTRSGRTWPPRACRSEPLQEWMGHRDLQTTQIYADYADPRRAARRTWSPGRSRAGGPVRGPILSES